MPYDIWKDISDITQAVLLDLLVAGISNTLSCMKCQMCFDSTGYSKFNA